MLIVQTGSVYDLGSIYSFARDNNNALSNRTKYRSSCAGCRALKNVCQSAEFLRSTDARGSAQWL